MNKVNSLVYKMDDNCQLLTFRVHECYISEVQGYVRLLVAEPFSPEVQIKRYDGYGYYDSKLKAVNAYLDNEQKKLDALHCKQQEIEDQMNVCRQNFKKAEEINLI